VNVRMRVARDYIVNSPGVVIIGSLSVYTYNLILTVISMQFCKHLKIGGGCYET